jgi:ABC-type Fe3+-citrate transport system substrate-binding protein
MASKVTTQTVVLAAQIAGVPVNINNTTNGHGSQLADSSKRISTAVTKNEELKVALNNQQLALINLAQSILAEQNNIADTTKRQDALNAILAAYDSHKVNMTVSMQAKGDK